MQARAENFENFGFCRCCLQQGYFKNLWSEYLWMAVGEIYGLMLSDCFSLPWEPDSKEKDLICESCILRLRDAFNFKKQVINSEDQLAKLTTATSSKLVANEYEDVQHLDDEISFTDTLEKCESVEDVLSVDDDECIKIIVADDSEVNPFETKPMTKRNGHYKQYSEASLLNCLAKVRSGILSAGQAAIRYNIPRKTISEKIRTNYPSTITGEDSASLTKNTYKNNNINFTKEVKTFLTLTNAIPFKTRCNKLHCLYCYKEFIDADVLKTHTRSIHSNERIDALDEAMGPKKLYDTLKIDVESLQCAKCCIGLDWSEVFHHLNDIHETVFEIAEKKLIPFILERNSYKCVICNENSLNFAQLDAHMNMHFKNYICDECAEPFLSYNRFIKHTQLHKQGEFPCHVCGKLFLKEKYMKKHLEGVHKREKKIQCRFCDEKFVSYYARHSHNLENHPDKVEIISCKYCSKSFDWNAYYMAHVRKEHLNERKHVCQECGLQFFMICELKKHVVTHTGDKPFECEVCKKRFSTNYGLKVHLKVHWENVLGESLQAPRKRRREKMHAIVREKLERTDNKESSLENDKMSALNQQATNS